MKWFIYIVTQEYAKEIVFLKKIKNKLDKNMRKSQINDSWILKYHKKDFE